MKTCIWAQGLHGVIVRKKISRSWLVMTPSRAAYLFLPLYKNDPTLRTHFPFSVTEKRGTQIRTVPYIARQVRHATP